ncbi:hypothetical protein OK074_4677 [Actinobacteria bacterium OK074]|nr:hypothetical protein OK074_4677 [Actinobacteria bacterium OK074]
MGTFFEQVIEYSHAMCPSLAISDARTECVVALGTEPP